MADPEVSNNWGHCDFTLGLEGQKEEGSPEPETGASVGTRAQAGASRGTKAVHCVVWR